VTLGDVAKRADFFPALFVLYSAEWWRRRYDGTGFSWEPILSSIGVPHESWSQVQRSECVERGFQDWKLRLSDSHGLRFLGSIAFQGGLPMRLLASARGNIGRVLRRVLQLASFGATDSREIQQWVESLSTDLPMAYRRAEVFVLLAEVIVTVLRLKEEAHLTQSANAIARLDELLPNWRDSFPLPIEDDQAKGLIEQLIRDAAGRAATQIQHITVERRLESSIDDSWSLRSDITLPEYLDSGTLSSLFQIEAQELTRTPTLRFIRDERRSDVSLRKLAGQERFRVERLPLESRDEIAAAEHTMQLLTHTGQSLHKEIARGDALDSELPWIFETGLDGSGAVRLTRQGSAAIASIKAILCAPTCWQVRAEDGTILTPMGQLTSPPRSLWTISGQVQAVAPDGLAFKVRCGQAAASNEQFELRGARVWETFVTPDRGFRGAPRLVHVTESGLEQVVQGGIAWRAQGNRVIQDGPDLVGPVTAVWPAQGDVRWRSRVVLLPTGAAVKVEPGGDVLNGVLRFSGWGLRALRCETAGVTCSTTMEGTSLSASIRYRGEDNPPEWLVFRGAWRDDMAEATFRMPFPAKGVRVMGATGGQLPNNSLIPNSDHSHGFEVVLPLRTTPQLSHHQHPGQVRCALVAAEHRLGVALIGMKDGPKVMPLMGDRRLQCRKRHRLRSTHGQQLGA